jgi:hypothetical protein
MRMEKNQKIRVPAVLVVLLPLVLQKKRPRKWSEALSNLPKNGARCLFLSLPLNVFLST